MSPAGTSTCAGTGLRSAFAALLRYASGLARRAKILGRQGVAFPRCWQPGKAGALRCVGTALLALAAGCACGSERSASAPPDTGRLLYRQDFEREGALALLLCSDPDAWRIGSGKSRALELFQQSSYKPAVRSPVNVALIDGQWFGDFVLEADVLQTGKEYGHRDLCLFFGFVGKDRFYYVHLASRADDHAHNVFVVDGKPRVKIATTTTAGVEWGSGVWHKVRLERRLGDGSIRVFFDDMTTPIMVAHDQRFGLGQIGFGSFDDTGMFDNVEVRGRETVYKQAEPFR